MSNLKRASSAKDADDVWYQGPVSLCVYLSWWLACFVSLFAGLSIRPFMYLGLTLNLVFSTSLGAREWHRSSAQLAVDGGAATRNKFQVALLW